MCSLAVFFFIWAADTLAYVAGRALGKHKLAPSISPKKTWEGFIGGIVGAVLVGVALKYTWLGYLAWPHVIVLALIGGIVGPLGDLAESGFKRSVGVKDSGNVLPGHGGLLDRFDALILTAPLYYLYLAYATDVFG
jgi:phosphatidate cytidylyltransferase